MHEAGSEYILSIGVALYYQSVYQRKRDNAMRNTNRWRTRIMYNGVCVVTAFPNYRVTLFKAVVKTPSGQIETHVWPEVLASGLASGLASCLASE